MTRPAQRRRLSRSVPPVSRAATTLIIGTAAISRPASELGSFFSACDSSPHGTIISSVAKASSGRQCRRSVSSCPPSLRAERSASGSRSTAPSAVLANTTTGTATSSTAILMNR